MTVYLHMCNWQLYLQHSGDEQTKKILILFFLFFNNIFCFLLGRTLCLLFHFFLTVHSSPFSCFILFLCFFPLSCFFFPYFLLFSILFLTVPLLDFFLLLQVYILRTFYRLQITVYWHTLLCVVYKPTKSEEFCYAVDTNTRTGKAVSR